MIIDTQVHLWEPNRPERPWVDGGPHFPHPERAVAAEEVLGVMANAGVDRAIIVPPPWQLGVNEIALTAAASHPEKFRVMALFDPTGQDAASRLGALLEERYVVGIRMMFTTDRTIAWLDPGVLNWFWAAAQRLHVPLMLYPPRSCEKLHWIAEQYPDLTIILDHLCLQQRKRDAEAFVGFNEMLQLARHPNVYAKLSSLPAYTSDRYPFKSLNTPIRRVRDSFGPTRMMWGSDYTKLPCEYGECVDHFRIALDFLSDEERASILGRTAQQTLRWD